MVRVYSLVGDVAAVLGMDADVVAEDDLDSLVDAEEVVLTIQDNITHTRWHNPTTHLFWRHAVTLLRNGMRYLVPKRRLLLKLNLTQAG